MLKGVRIIIVLCSLELGGAERQAILLARYLRSCGSIVQVWGFGSASLAARLCDENGIPWRIVDFQWPKNLVQWVRGLLKLGVTLRKVCPDVLLPYTMWPNAACGSVWRWTGARSCIWNQRDIGLSRMGRVIEIPAVCQTPVFVSNSEEGSKFLFETLKVDSKRIKIVRNGVELLPALSSRDDWRKRLELRANSFVACMVANVTKLKDHSTLLRAYQEVCKEIDSELLLAGYPGDNYENLIKLTHELDLSKKVHFLGQIRDIPGLLDSVDLGVFSSKLEGCPNGVLESMAAGLAIAGTDIPGIRELVGPCGHPFLAPPGNATVLAQRILVLARDPGLRRDIGKKNQHRVRTQFGARRMCEEMAAIIVESLQSL